LIILICIFLTREVSNTKENNDRILIDLSFENISNNIIWQGNWAPGCDFPGNDLVQIQTTGENCGGECDRNPACTHWYKFF
jgi:hypothetical protein